MDNKPSKEEHPASTASPASSEKTVQSKKHQDKEKVAGEESKNRGWPKGKKRYPKSPGAPKQPLSGYVHFLNDRREAVRKGNPDLSFADISKKLAVEWGQVDTKQKQDYVERAEADKERYNKEFAEYQHTDNYKQFIETQKQKATNTTSATAGGVPATKRPAEVSSSR